MGAVRRRAGHTRMGAVMNLTAIHAASVASQRRAQQLNAYWDRMYWIRETTRLYWGLPT